jgi:hypothetical protein
MLTGKPFFMVGIDVSGCVYDIRINVITVLASLDGLPVTVNLPVNESMITGRNRLSVILHPLPGEEEISGSAEVTATLLNRQSGTPRESNLRVADIRYRHGPTEPEDRVKESSPEGAVDSTGGFAESPFGDVTVGAVETIASPDGKQVIVQREIELDTSLPRWSWTDSDLIPATDETRNELVQEYLRIRDMLKAGNVSGMLAPLFSERTRELATAYYTPETEMAPSDLEEIGGDPDYEISDMYEDRALFRVLGEGKLAKLLFWNGAPLIGFNHKTEEMSRDFDITFRKSGESWIITR